MDLIHILIFTFPAVLLTWLVPHRWQSKMIMAISIFGMYWLQPALPIRNLDFWLPSITLSLIVLVWAITRPPAPFLHHQSGRLPIDRDSKIAIILLILVFLAISLTRYTSPFCCITPSQPPPIWQPILAIAITAIVASFPLFVLIRHGWLATLAIILIIFFFFILKSEILSRTTSSWLRLFSGQSPDFAAGSDLRWLGYSYLAFRLLHVLRDYQKERLPVYSLDEFVVYAVFWPSFPSGPIDRVQRFIGDLRHVVQAPTIHWPAWYAPGLKDGGSRILTGVFKKFVLADTLALIALNAQNAFQIRSAFWLWILLIAFSLYIYLDFSGYTDIAIGFGRLLGIHLPENFDRPYQKASLTAFWNSWNMTLAQWFRAYFFNPLTRYLRTGQKSLSSWLIILISQVSTMALIGLWHGLTLNFLIWGLWHGIGLFINNRWSEWIKPRFQGQEGNPRLIQSLHLGGWFLTFMYVTLGWVWFIMPTPASAILVFSKLVGR